MCEGTGVSTGVGVVEGEGDCWGKGMGVALDTAHLIVMLPIVHMHWPAHLVLALSRHRHISTGL